MMNPGDFLARMAASSRERVRSARQLLSDIELEERVAVLSPPPAPRFTADAFHLIAEVKRRSPAAGQLAAASLSPAEQARRYALGGAAVISVLTEPDAFDGDLAHVTQVTEALPSMPVMRKDFLVDRYQVLEARAAGAAGVLLIAAMLEPRQLMGLIDSALALGMFVLVEVFDRDDLQRCRELVQVKGTSASARGRVLIGVNCRDLRSLQVDFNRFALLAPYLPPGLPWVAESGIETPAQAAEVVRLGYRLALVGTALMRAGDPAEAAQALLAAGRHALIER